MIVPIFSVLFPFLWCLIAFKVIEFYLRKRKISSADLAKRYVFITGCDTGFGNRLVRRLDKNTGLGVFAGCLTDQGRMDLDKSTSERVQVLSLDVTDHESVAQCFKEVKDRLPPETGKSQ